MRIYTLILRLRISARTKGIEMTLWTDIRTDRHTDGHTDRHCSRDSDISQEAQKVHAILCGFKHQ